MIDTDRRIREHWAARDNVRSMAAALAVGDSRLERPTVEDLAPRDQLHAGTIEATARFVDWAGVGPGQRVLDLGSGLGGSARFLASRTGVRVTALELCDGLHDTAAELTRRCGLSHLVDHVRGDGTRPTDIGGGGFDVIWIQHVDMQVRDKAGLYATVARCLAPGGRVVWHDWLAGAGGAPRWPVFWSEDGAISFHIPEAEFRDNLRRAGLTLARFEVIADETMTWFGKGRREIAAARSSLRAKSPPPLERLRKLEHLLLEMDNAILNTREERLIPFFAEARAEANS
ncbi:MAG TPA: methyltransferase domain-containing protein [Polyangia bacterium]|nr:methyltransferase domain-containing protein [Polyangia bacterium]